MVTPGQNTAKTRILVVDDHPLYRRGLIDFINSQPGLVCCGEADGCETGRHAARQLKPDLVILDLGLGDDDGMELLKNVVAEHPNLPVLVLSQRDETAYAQPVLQAGARGYIMKEEATEEVLHAIEAVLGGEVYVSRRLSGVIVRRLMLGQQGDDVIGKLTDREVQVYQFIGNGLDNREIAEQLRLSVKTVETHRENIKRKLGLKDGHDLVKSAKAWVKKAER